MACSRQVRHRRAQRDQHRVGVDDLFKLTRVRPGGRRRVHGGHHQRQPRRQLRRGGAERGLVGVVVVRGPPGGVQPRGHEQHVGVVGVGVGEHGEPAEAGGAELIQLAGVDPDLTGPGDEAVVDDLAEPFVDPRRRRGVQRGMGPVAPLPFPVRQRQVRFGMAGCGPEAGQSGLGQRRPGDAQPAGPRTGRAWQWSRYRGEARCRCRCRPGDAQPAGPRTGRAGQWSRYRSDAGRRRWPRPRCRPGDAQPGGAEAGWGERLGCHGLLSSGLTALARSSTPASHGVKSSGRAAISAASGPGLAHRTPRTSVSLAEGTP